MSSPFNIRQKTFLVVEKIKKYLFFIFTYFIQQCFICRHSDSTVSDGIEPRTVLALALAIQPLGQISYPLVRSHPHQARSHPHYRLDLIHTIGSISSTQGQIPFTLQAESHPHSVRSHLHQAMLSHPYLLGQISSNYPRILEKIYMYCKMPFLQADIITRGKMVPLLSATPKVKVFI